MTMRNLIICILLVSVCSLQSCKTRKEFVPTVVERINVETRFERIYETDTVYIDVPAQKYERETKDSTSYLETDFATSFARVTSDGLLFHNLQNKERSIEVPVDKVVERKDSIVYRDREVEVPVPVEKKLTKWQEFKIEYAGLLMLIAICELVVLFRKPLYTAFRKVITKP